MSLLSIWYANKAEDHIYFCDLNLFDNIWGKQDVDILFGGLISSLRLRSGVQMNAVALKGMFKGYQIHKNKVKCHN